MDYSETEEMQMIRETARKIVNDYDREYVKKHVEEKEFPEEFWQDLADNGFVGTMIEEEYGGAGMGMVEMAVILEELAREGSPGGLLLVLTAIFGGVGIQKHGTEEQKDAYLPRSPAGTCSGVWASPSRTPESTRSRLRPPPRRTATSTSSTEARPGTVEPTKPI